MEQRLEAQLEAMAEHVGDAVAFVDLASGERLSFRHWNAEADRLAARLQRGGIRRGERVAIDLPPERSVRWVCAYAAVHKAGAVAVPVNTRMPAAERAAVLAHSGAAALIASGADVAALAGRAEELCALRLVVDEDGATPEGAWPPGLQVLGPAPDEAADAGFRPVPVGPDDLADILYTSGTTGRPKGVVVRHANASMLPNAMPVWSGDGWLSASPLFTFAGITAVYNPMKLGMTSLYLPRFDPAAWMDAVERERPTMVFLVPAMAELLLAHPRFCGADLSSVGLCAVGSAPLPVGTWRRLQERMGRAAVSNAYGMTEAGTAYTVLPKEEAARRAGSVGRPLPPAEFFVVDRSGRRLGPDEVGELVVRVPGRPREYYRDPEATARTWHPDGLHTGDLAYLDADGYVYVVGRTKDVIIRGGHNVHAADVEAVLAEHPDVREVAVAGVAHPMLGEDVAAWVVPAEGRRVDPDGLRSWLAARLADYKVPRRITVVERLPRNATGKVVKRLLPGVGPVPGSAAAPQGSERSSW